MGRPQIDYKKICKEQEIEIVQIKSSLLICKKVNEDLIDERDAFERQAIKFAGVIDYLEEKLEELKEHNEHP